MINHHRGLENMDHALTHTLQIVPGLQLYNGRKLITRQPRHHVPPSQNALDTVGGVLQHAITAFVAVEIINRFEEIEIHEQHGEPATVTGALGHTGLEELLEQGAVRQLGEGVVVSQRGQTLVARRHIANIREHTGPESTISPLHGIDCQPLGIGLAVLSAVPDQSLPATVSLKTFPHSLIELGRLQARTQ